jgi:superfamily II DNA/RNA helicase
MLKQKDFNKVLIFGRTKHGVEKLSSILLERGFKSESIHGNKNHVQRQRALGKFKDNLSQVLVATDVAARGIDVLLQETTSSYKQEWTASETNVS